MSSIRSLVPPAENLTGTQVYRAIRERYINQNGSAKRCRSKRPPWVTHITVSISGDDGRPCCTEITTTHDISRYGVSFVWRQSIEPGTIVTVWFEALPHRPELAAEVRHCTHIGDIYHHIGTEFIEAPGVS